MIREGGREGGLGQTHTPATIVYFDPLFTACISVSTHLGIVSHTMLLLSFEIAYPLVLKLPSLSKGAFR